MLFADQNLVMFDFGVPLEDVFPTSHVHSRLKILLAHALQACRDQDVSIQGVLRYGQGSVAERLALKTQLVLAPNGQLGDSQPGAYLWVLRHFLGLLPLPLFPSCTMGVQFNWAQLASGCRKVFKCRRHLRGILDRDIARALNTLPTANLRLINLLMPFMRKLSVGEKTRFSRGSLKALCYYFCDALFVRPFWPGLVEQDHFHPLFLYLIVRWHKIAPYCSVFTTAAIKGFNEIACQTASERAEVNVPDATQFCTAQDFSFESVLDEDENWQSIVQETMRTVQRVEEAFIYDDYESFSREEFNQIGQPEGPLLLQASTPKNQSSESDNSYFKFPDVCEDLEENVAKLHEGKTVGQMLFQNDSPTAVQQTDSHEPLHGAKKKGKNFRKISLNLLRTFKPSRGAFQRKLSYMRMPTI